MDVFAVIPARGGSKRIENKNVREVDGKPLIAHTLDQVSAASSIDRAIVSTDSQTIADAARRYGGDVPFERPAELADDEATSPPVVEHALEWVRGTGADPDIVVMLQVTTPLRTADDIDGAVEKLRSREDATSIVSVTEFDTPPYWAVEKDDSGNLTSYFEEDVLWVDEIPRSQDLKTLYYPNGAVFAARTEVFENELNFYTESTLSFEMPPQRSFDIDEPWELDLVRQIFESRRKDIESDG